MTSTSVVLGVARWARLRQPRTVIALRTLPVAVQREKRSRISSDYPLDSVMVGVNTTKSTFVLFKDKKIYPSAKHFMKKFLASINLCSRF